MHWASQIAEVIGRGQYGAELPLFAHPIDQLKRASRVTCASVNSTQYGARIEGEGDLVDLL